jgi:dihydropteroate synthase
MQTLNFALSQIPPLLLSRLKFHPMPPRRKFRLHLPSGRLLLGQRTLIMAVLNVTSDSFSDGNQFLDPQLAIDHALKMQSAGADIIDIGGESTRPGSSETPADIELGRILPVLDGLSGTLTIPISIDTRKSQVAEAVIRAGAQLINDVSGLRSDPQLAKVAAHYKVPLILMHMRGEPATMQTAPFARDVLKDVTQGLRHSIAIARKAGVAKSQIILDPGIGFGKSFAQNYELLRKLPLLVRLGYPLLVGTSRKGFLGATLAWDGKPAPTDARIWGTAATVTASILAGAHIVRVHDVNEMAQVTRVADCLLDPALCRKFR